MLFRFAEEEAFRVSPCRSGISFGSQVADNSRGHEKTEC